MFKVYKMMGNTSKEVAMFETGMEAEEFMYNSALEECEDGLSTDLFSAELENQLSYFSIEDDRRELIDEDTLTGMYDNMLDESYVVSVAGMSYCPSTVLEKCDPIAYKCGLSDFYDSISDQYYCEGME